MYLNHTATAAPLLVVRLSLLRAVLCALASARAWLIVADLATSVLSELCRFPLLNYSVFVVVVVGRLSAVLLIRA